MEASSFSQYRFAYFSAIDILLRYPLQAEAFLQDIRPKSLGNISHHPLDRCQDLYFLNTAEQFASLLGPQCNEELLVTAARPYLGVHSDNRLRGIFEAAHSVMLAVMLAPQNSDLLSRHLHPYIEALFAVFPENLSPRQFRFAIRALVQLTSPLASISMEQPLLPSVILELVLHRLDNASDEPLPQHSDAAVLGLNSTKLADHPDESILSERSALVVTLIDALPVLPPAQLEDLLPVVAQTLHSIPDITQRQACIERFWDILSKGEMDVGRSDLCIMWWTNQGGKELVLNGTRDEHSAHLMSGALTENAKL